MTRGWKSWRLGLVLGSALAGFGAGELRATEAETTDANKERLVRLLSGESPKTVDDLKLIQTRVHELTDRLIACTVGVQVGPAWGSGVIVSKDGYVLTAAHVCGQPGRDVRFMLSDGRVVKGKTLGLFRTQDAGLMKITEDGEYPAAEMGKSDVVNDHQWCLATGHPGGYQDDRKPVLRLGRVLVNAADALTTDCTLVGGDSGGPLFDLEGRVIGINSRIGSKITSNMHVPVNTYREAWDRMLKGEAWGYLEGHEPFIGIRADEKSSNKVAHVTANSPAAKAGVKEGDILLSLNDQTIGDFDAFRNAIRERQPGDKVKLQVRRGEEMLSFDIKLARKGG